MDKKAYEIALRTMAPPRAVPLSCRLALLFNAGVQVGFFVLAITTPFLWYFVAGADFPSLTFRGETMKTNGVVTEIRDTQTSENDRRIRELRYGYSIGAQQYEGVSYESGETDFESGDLVIVEYLKRDPARSRIEGMRRGMLGAGDLFVLIFPAVGLVVTLVALTRGARRSRILVRGIAVFARHKETRRTNMTVNKRRVFEVIHEYRTMEGELQEASTRTTYVEPLTDEEQELLLYDPSRPNRGVPIDSIAPLPELDGGGGFRGNFAGAALRLIFPTLVVGGNVVWMIHRG